jgi:hypothetical protein
LEAILSQLFFLPTSPPSHGRDRRFEFQKRGQDFIGADDEALS